VVLRDEYNNLSMSTPTITPTPVSVLPPQEIPPLQNGDHLTRAEFERRYQAMPELKKAELIEGVVYVPSPVIWKQHGGPHFDFIGWSAHYCAYTPGVEGGDNSTLRMDLDNEPQPDVFLRIKPSHGGQSVTDDDGYVEGAPELVCEIAATSASYDLHDKLKAYRRNKVREYIVWRVLDLEIDWFILRHERYEKMDLSPDGIIRSELFHGLWLDPAAMIRRDMPAVLKVLQQGIASPEHATFVAELEKAATKGRP
jgi:Uma2 family endonuclease